MRVMQVSEGVAQYAEQHGISVADVYCVLVGEYKRLGMNDEAQRCFDQFMFLTFGE